MFFSRCHRRNRRPIKGSPSSPSLIRNSKFLNAVHARLARSRELSHPWCRFINKALSLPARIRVRAMLRGERFSAPSTKTVGPGQQGWGFFLGLCAGTAEISVIPIPYQPLVLCVQVPLNWRNVLYFPFSETPPTSIWHFNTIRNFGGSGVQHQLCNYSNLIFTFWVKSTDMNDRQLI